MLVRLFIFVEKLHLSTRVLIGTLPCPRPGRWGGPVTGPLLASVQLVICQLRAQNKGRKDH